MGSRQQRLPRVWQRSLQTRQEGRPSAGRVFRNDPRRRSEALVLVLARRRLEDARFTDCSALRWMGPVLRVGVAWIGCGAWHCVARTVAALADGLGRDIGLAATTSPSLSLRPANRRGDASPLCGLGATRRSGNDLLAYGDGLRMRPASESAALARARDRPRCRWLRRPRSSDLRRLAWASVPE
jgi:hypothetical protein